VKIYENTGKCTKGKSGQDDQENIGRITEKRKNI
jgi:hypothetical protein